MPSLAGVLILIRARARRPGRWLLPVLGVALAATFAGAVVAEATIAGDRGARSVLGSLGPADRVVRVTWQGTVTPSVARRASALLDGLGLADHTSVTLLSPVRLGGVLVRPAAIAPLRRWVAPGALTAVGRCTERSCPVLSIGPGVSARVLSTAGARLKLAGTAALTSAAALGYVPSPGSARQTPLLLSGDPTGLAALPGLSGTYRTESWFALLPASGLQSWELAALERRLQQAQAALLQHASQFSLAAPFAALDAARAQASAAPERVLLAGGGALAAIAVFIVLAAAELRRDQAPELERLRGAGARASQCLFFSLAETALLCAVGIGTGAVASLGAAALLAGDAGLPVGGVLDHALLTPAIGGALLGSWIVATTLLGAVLLAPSDRSIDVLALASVAALTLALANGGSHDPLVVLLAPLFCVAAAAITFRLAGGTLARAERLIRGGPMPARLAIVNLARKPSAPAAAIAFLAVSTGLGGFALAYRATLVRGIADQAANVVPLDATVSPASDFTTPLELAPLTRWRALSAGTVLPVRRTDATYPNGDGELTVPALGIPAAGLHLIHGWRTSDGPAPLRVLARRLRPSGAPADPLPALPAGTRELALRISSPGLAVSVAADLLDPVGSLRAIPLGVARRRASTLRAAVPPGPWRLAALELDEPSGLAATNGHQNAENPAAATQFATAVRLEAPVARAASGQRLASIPLVGWRGLGAASITASRVATSGAARTIRFTASGTPGIVRPPAPSDSLPVPVLADPSTASAASEAGTLALTVDGQPVRARVVGVISRFPTVPPDQAGFVVADEATLASALDAQLPGQGAADELWISTREPARLRAALRGRALQPLGASFRADVQRRLRSEPVARSVQGTLIAASAITDALAVLGLLLALLGAGRDPHVELDLLAQGLGPRTLRTELRLRFLLAGALGVGAGLLVGVALTRLAVASVRAAATLAPPDPTLVTVTPWAQLALWALVTFLLLAAASVIATGPRWKLR